MAKITVETHDLMDFTEAAKYLGVSRQTIYNMIEEEKLHPIALFGKARLLYRYELDQIKRARA